MKRKSIKIIATTLLLSTILSFTSLAGWEQSEAGWKYKDDNTQQYVTDRWIESNSEQGLWYYIKADGIMATNAWIDDVYYVNEAGEWREIEPVDWRSHTINDLSNVTSGGPITEEEKASGQNFLNHR